MKNFLLNGLYSLMILFLIAGCAVRVDFPVSDRVPAADISARVKSDKNNNYELEVKAEYLAEPERLDENKKAYVVWVITSDNRQQNMGELRPDNDKSAELQGLTPLKPFRIIVTAEEDVSVSRPGSMTIFRSEEISL